MHFVTNFPNFPTEWQTADGRRGTTQMAQTAWEFLRHRRDADTVFVVDGNIGLVMQLAAAFLLSPFGHRPPFVIYDLILRRPLTWRQRVLHPLKRFLLSRGDLYLNSYTDVRAYEELYAIPTKRCAFVPFKPNLREDVPSGTELAGTTEEYVLCFGRSLRDFDTFFAAVERLPWPAAIPRPDFVELRKHGARFTRALDQLPANVTLIDDNGSAASQAAILRRAKLVVLPVLKTSIVSSGISTCLNAMLLGKCVIGSTGPGMSDIFTDEVLTVPPEDSAALAASIDRAWRDDALRQRTAAAGHRYALALGGTAELAQRIIDRIAAASPSLR
jgi:glycosyltransferase involved in cell wall biosynthesis